MTAWWVIMLSLGGLGLVYTVVDLQRRVTKLERDRVNR